MYFENFILPFRWVHNFTTNFTTENISKSIEKKQVRISKLLKKGDVKWWKSMSKTMFKIT